MALTLRLVGGLTTEEIARAFLVPEPTIAQRIVRAKRTLAEKHVPFEVPRGEELAERLASVLEVVYLIFNEGYSATAGEDWLRPQLAQEALRLGRILAALAPEEPEVHGLVALMEIQASRFKARTAPDGEPILLLDQNRALWDRLLIGRGLAALERAEESRQRTGIPLGPYALQAAIAACHARAAKAEETDWPASSPLYDALAASAPSPIVELNRAVAVAMASGPAAGLPLVDRLADEPALKNYHLLPTVRGDFLTSSTASTRRAANSSAPPRSPRTRASAPCSSPARQSVRDTEGAGRGGGGVSDDHQGGGGEGGGGREGRAAMTGFTHPGQFLRYGRILPPTTPSTGALPSA